MECDSDGYQEIGIFSQSMFEVHVWDFEADTFYKFCTEETLWAAVNSDDDYEQSIEMVGTCDEDGR
jgi:hypothetical protein